jgi:cytidylate kinase
MVKNVILISGKLQSGKNTFTDMLMKELQPTGLKVGFDFFAKSVKDQCKDIFKTLTDYLNDVSEKFNVPELKTIDDNWYETKNKITRILLQTYGTDIFREMVDANWWAKILQKRVCTERTEDILFITDVRFKSEIAAMLDKTPFRQDYRTITPKYNVIKIRVERDNFDRPDDPIFNHPSEIDLDDYSDWDLVIKNNSDLSSLSKQAEQTTSFILGKFSKKSSKN